ncbi:nucleotidyltransferase domain-containing protein [Bacillus cereus]|uniref:nucleotidyltransferase domain-containing protein n=1 Tax=Bacillus cereus TaxID=1396 RepID=UPI000BF775DB|nr:nucleotidyltransferase domain-containing protein [Bacillus cereus]PFS93955.1 hypothetical protein COK58_21330 [Bacillus cereus]
MIKKDDFEEIEDLLSIVLFGSKAREEEDDFSDVDIFLLVEDVPQARIVEIINITKAKLPFRNIGISLYTISTYKKLIFEGSMFLWHLKLEGKIIYKKSTLNLYNGLSPFNNFKKNYIIYESLLKKSELSFQENGINEYDLSQLFFICRNLCLLTCFKVSSPTFGRISVYDKLIDIIGFKPLSREHYIYLSQWRLNYTRAVGFQLEFPTEEKIVKILKEINDLFIVCKEIIENGERNDEKLIRNKTVSWGTENR